MDCSPTEYDVNVVSSVEPEGLSGLVADLGSLYDYLARLEDRRDPRGVRYQQVHVPAFVLLAKLAGEDRLSAIAERVWHRKEALAQALGLPCPQAPRRTTYSRILGTTLPVEALEGMMGECFARNRADGQLVQITIDGKTLRGRPGARTCWPLTCPAKAWCWPRWKWTARKTRSRRPRDC